MKIVYMYIQSYGCLQNRGFLFDAHYSVKEAWQNNTLCLTIEEKDEFLDSILYGNMSVTAIVGDNGSGKSTCLDALQSWLVDFDNNPGVVIWENDKKLFYQPQMECTIRIESTFGDLEEYVAGQAPLPLNVVFFSDVLESIDESRRALNEENCINSYTDISTTKMLLDIEAAKYLSPLRELYMKDSLFQIKLADGLIETDHSYPWNSILGERYLYFQTLNINYILRKLDIRSTDLLSFNTEFSKVLIRMSERDMYFNGISVIQETLFFDYIRSLNRYLIQLKIGPHESRNKVLFEIIDYLFGEYMEHGREGYFFDSIFYEYCQDSYLEKEQELMEKYKSEEGGFPFFEKYVVFFDMLQHKPWIVEGIDKIIKSSKWRNSINVYERTVQIYIPQGEKIQDLYKLYSDIRTYEELLKFDWMMSSGENSISVLFGRLYDSVKRIQIRDEYHFPYLIIIDEIDNLYHPRWQQKIIFWISKFLNYKFSSYKFQVIITTHSPVLLSDIPVSRVIFMSNDSIQQGNNTLGHRETFAANVSTLYYDAFFMREGSIGEIAKEVVDLLYEIFTDDYVKSLYVLPASSNDIEKNKETLCKCMLSKLNRRYEIDFKISHDNVVSRVLQLINIVGEDIWREQLRVLYNKYFVLRNTHDSAVTKIHDILNKFNSEEKDAILREIMEDGFYKQEIK